jgi:hypothetical protein
MMFGAAVTNSELAEWLNVTGELSGPDRVTANVVRQWVGWDVLPKARARGQVVGRNPKWSRTDSALRRALRLAELRQAGVKRENAVVVQAYIEWGHPDFARVRSALLSEFRKWRNQLIRRKITLLEGRPYASASAAELRAIQKQNGPLAERFVGTPFQLTKEAYAVLADAAHRSQSNSVDLSRLIQGAISNIDPQVAGAIPPQYIAAITNSFSGLIGLESEISNSGETVIQKASERQFREARYFIRKFGTMVQRAGDIGTDVNSGSAVIKELSALGPQVSVGPWAVIGFVQGLKLIVSI